MRTYGAAGRVLVAGWFSWPDCGATAGDLSACDVVCDWLARAGREFDVAVDGHFGEGVDWRRVEPRAYSDVVFVCGPMHPGASGAELFSRFDRARKVGIDLSMIEPLSNWNPFDILWERDSERRCHADLAFIAPFQAVPIVGLVLVEPYPPEYPGRDRQEEARRAATNLVHQRPGACIEIDTRLKDNATGLRSAREIETVIARTDVVVTTRLHGLVLALKHGVPAVAIDPVAGGAKISRQAETVGWPVVRSADRLDDEELGGLFDYCLTPAARNLARTCAEQAATLLHELESEFTRTLSAPST
jgi:polysaccharide pyruvyl transferase